MSMTHQKSEPQFRATSGDLQGFGATPREALDALMERLHQDVTAPIVIWPFNRGDTFCMDAQQERLRDLKARRETLTPSEHAELERLVASAFEATVSRTQSTQPVKS